MQETETDSLLVALNPPQQEAVTYGDGALLVLAGAGSGKTRVLTHRIAWLIQRRGVDPRSVLALTFTNKAAREMSTRVEKLLGGQGGGVWLGTFHAIALRILRRHAEYLAVGRDFGIYDAADQLRLAKAVFAELTLNQEKFSPSGLLSEVQKAKDEGRGPEPGEAQRGNPHAVAFHRFYQLYQKKLMESRALDFGDLLLSTLQLFSTHPEVADSYARRFKHLLIDEYQDTNRVQHLLAQRLAATWGNICVVGDDDQSIYGWRGADLRNILAFEEAFPGVHIIKLEQNYRSTAPILDAASAVIRRNRSRREKTLWTARSGGAPLEIHVADTEEDEARWIVRKIAKLISSEGMRPSDMAILYRTNALSRPLEEALSEVRFPNVVYGGQRFYERREVKDVLAYLRLAVRPDDSVAFARVVNMPPRGIGNRTVEVVLEENSRRGEGMWSAVRACIDNGLLATRAAKALTAFFQMVEGWREALPSMPVNLLLDRILDETGYRELLQRGGMEGVDRLENIAELLSAAEAFERDGGGRVAEFLDRAALVSDLDRAAGSLDAVTLMSIHSAKGLEFPCVFVAGLEEGVFPHQFNLYTEEGIEEERRLCYVAFTRARDRLFLSRARVRRVFGAESFLREPSRFLRELSTAGINTERRVETKAEGELAVRFGRPKPPKEEREVVFAPDDDGDEGSYYLPEPDHCVYEKGMRVRHKKFGVGTIGAVEGRGPMARLAVDFAAGGRKKFVAGLSGLEIRRDD